MATMAELARSLDAAAREALIQELPEAELRARNLAFAEWAHPGQMPPAGDWRTWVIMAGRGYGKTRAGAEWVLSLVRPGMSAREDLPLHHAAHGPPPHSANGEEMRIALVAATIEEAAAIMVEGPSGILACAGPGEILDWQPSRHVLRFKGGAAAFLFSGANPQGLRGPQHHFAWCDELAKWRHSQGTWDMLQLGLRCGPRPRALVTTTPRGGCAALGGILGAADTVVTGGASHANPHLPQAWLEAIDRAWGGTRMGREEIDGLFLPDVEGSLWPSALIEASRGPVPAREDLVRVVIGVDPPASAAGTCGIVVCGLDGAGLAHVLADCSAGGLSPEGWARAVARAALHWQADRVVAEKNMGGDMVRSVLRGSGAELAITLVSASRGKVRRAEPVAGLFENGRARLAGRFAELEDELGGLVAAGGYQRAGASTGSGSPDRADAMVWALTSLCLGPSGVPRVLDIRG